jgi:hypothetical protein|tara:strand:- start:211 stop:465 length:255 start_codon:yes stop_codon:yes gene_type:complete
VTETFEVGDLVRDKLNMGDQSYGLGVVVKTESTGLIGEVARNGEPNTGWTEAEADPDIPGKRYDVYFNKFERTITFHGDYLERV